MQTGKRFVYSMEDTVFIYDTVQSSFAPLLAFNLNVGDTIRLPYRNYSIIFPGDDLDMSLVVDSISLTSIEGLDNLTTIHLTPLCPILDVFVEPITFIEKIGSFSLLFFNENACGFVNENDLRCYSDDELLYKSSMTDECIDFSTSTSEIVNSLKLDLNVYPNPASNQINFDYSLAEGLHEEATLNVYNLSGKLIRQFDIPNASGRITWNLEEVNNGIYLYQITSRNMISQPKQFLVNKK